MTKPPSITGDDYLDRVVETIVEHKVCIQAVGAGEKEPAFAYTIGLQGGVEAPEHPEIIVFGLPFSVAHTVLNDLASKVLEEGVTLSPGEERHDVFRGFPARFLEVKDSTEHLCVANALFGEDGPIPALQLIFPDAEGRWPWDADSGVAAMPLLGEVQ